MHATDQIAVLNLKAIQHKNFQYMKLLALNLDSEEIEILNNFKAMSDNAECYGDDYLIFGNIKYFNIDLLKSIQNKLNGILTFATMIGDIDIPFEDIVEYDLNDIENDDANSIFDIIYDLMSFEVKYDFQKYELLENISLLDFITSENEMRDSFFKKSSEAHRE